MAFCSFFRSLDAGRRVAAARGVARGEPCRFASFWSRHARFEMRSKSGCGGRSRGGPVQFERRRRHGVGVGAGVGGTATEMSADADPDRALDATQLLDLWSPSISRSLPTRSEPAAVRCGGSCRSRRAPRRSSNRSAAREQAARPAGRNTCPDRGDEDVIEEPGARSVALVFVTVVAQLERHAVNAGKIEDPRGTRSKPATSTAYRQADLSCRESRAGVDRELDVDGGADAVLAPLHGRADARQPVKLDVLGVVDRESRDCQRHRPSPEERIGVAVVESDARARRRGSEEVPRSRTPEGRPRAGRRRGWRPRASRERPPRRREERDLVEREADGPHVGAERDRA